MPRLRSNGGFGRLEPREGTITLVPPEGTAGSHGTLTPLGTKESVHTPPRPEPIRIGLPVSSYDPSAAARAAMAADPGLDWTRRAVAEAEQRFGPRPATIRGLPGADQFQAWRRKMRTARPAVVADPGSAGGAV